ncbi:MAG: peptidase C11 [Lachnospiraceae bacterium]|nr:peptidase C11 [Lachnospiraceae bacterium]
MAGNRPQGREKHVTSGGSGVNKRGDGLGTGPVGAGGYGAKGSSGRKRAAVTGGISAPVLIFIIVFYLIANKGAGSSGSSNYSQYTDSYTSTQTVGTSEATSTQQVDTSVASGARDKRTEIIGNGEDVMTMMVYMCGTDLESKNGMASADLQEMAQADIGENVNIIIYTGGCAGWRTQGISNSVNQIYQLQNGNLKRLVEDDGAKPMTDPNTLSSFIKYAAKNYPANRYALIFWDHGGGSVSGYGYDEKYKSSGSMGLGGIRQALENGGVTYDFIGFDACLMATAETALMLDDYADYLIASEETEPGIGWYYTTWLNKLGANPSMPTTEIGKNIIDGFTDACAQRVAGQKTTLSLIDLAEFAHTVPDKLSAFSGSVSGLIEEKDYKTVSDARYSTREFATSSKIDQVDLVDLSTKMGTEEGKELAEAIKGAVKYNRTSSNMTNAYGVSIYFPYKRTSYVDTAVKTYDQIGMDDEYSKCIKAFAALETSGQVSTGGTANPLEALTGSLSGGGSSLTSSLASAALTAFLSNRSSVDGLDRANTDFMEDNLLSTDETAEYIAMNHFDEGSLVWTENAEGKQVIALSEEQWDMVHMMELNMFYDDGEGYVDLGTDNVFDYDEEGNLLAPTDRTWLAINGQVVAYYYLDTTETDDGYVITGRVPCYLNGTERVNLILVFDEEHPYGYIAGATTDYVDGETDTVAKSMTELSVGDTLDFVCDYYTYDEEYQDSYFLGDTLTVTEEMEISNVDVGSGPVRVMYKFSDIYNQNYWTPALIIE